MAGMVWAQMVSLRTMRRTGAGESDTRDGDGYRVSGFPVQIGDIRFAKWIAPRHDPTGKKSNEALVRHRRASVFNFRKSKDDQSRDGQKDLTTLNSESPAEAVPSQETSAPSAQPQGQPIQPPAQATGIQAEINRRGLELAKSGRHPEAIFLLVDPTTHTPISVTSTNPPSLSVMLFSSAANARFFMQDRKLSVEMRQVEFDKFPRIAEQLRSHKFDSFVMDVSPKSPMCNVLRAKDELITLEQLTFAWALMRTIRNFQAQRYLGPLCFKNPEFGSPAGQDKLRRALEELRGAGAYDVPFLHWVIALIAGMQHDEPARLTATADLEAFGPDFVGRTVCAENEESLAEWRKSWGLAFTGLLTEFEMISGPDGKPLESSLRTKNIVD